MITLKTILHPTDFSESSRYALELACALARDQAARVVILHVLPRPASLIGGDVPAHKAHHAEEDLKAYRDEMSNLLAKVRERASCAQVDTKLKEGPVAEVISRTAAETPCDLVVMGSHGQSRVRAAMLGSVAAAVTRSAHCPVVTVEIPEQEVTAQT
jgi:nucleotide-binding universal stress UspA family protein